MSNLTLGQSLLGSVKLEDTIKNDQVDAGEHVFIELPDGTVIENPEYVEPALLELGIQMTRDNEESRKRAFKVGVSHWNVEQVMGSLQGAQGFAAKGEIDEVEKAVKELRQRAEKGGIQLSEKKIAEINKQAKRVAGTNAMERAKQAAERADTKTMEAQWALADRLAGEIGEPLDIAEVKRVYETAYGNRFYRDVNDIRENIEAGDSSAQIKAGLDRLKEHGEMAGFTPDVIKEDVREIYQYGYDLSFARMKSDSERGALESLFENEQLLKDYAQAGAIVVDEAKRITYIHQGLIKAHRVALNNVADTAVDGDVEKMEQSLAEAEAIVRKAKTLGVDPVKVVKMESDIKVESPVYLKEGYSKGVQPTLRRAASESYGGELSETRGLIAKVREYAAKGGVTVDTKMEQEIAVITERALVRAYDTGLGDAESLPWRHSAYEQQSPMAMAGVHINDYLESALFQEKPSDMVAVQKIVLETLQSTLREAKRFLDDGQKKQASQFVKDARTWINKKGMVNKDSPDYQVLLAELQRVETQISLK